MSSTKISVSVDEDVLAEARQHAGGARQLSGYVNDAIRLVNNLRAREEYLSEAEGRVGPVPEELVREAEALWQSER